MASTDGCGRDRCNVTSSSPLTVTSVTFAYQSLRGFLRNLSFDFSWIRSKVHLTSAEVNGLPSCHLTPCRSLKVSVFLSPLQAQLSARSGTMVSMLFCAMLWL